MAVLCGSAGRDPSIGEAQQDVSAGERPGSHPSLSGGAEGGWPRVREEIGTGADGTALADERGEVVECAKARVASRAAEQQQTGRDQR